jgi:hypothetical protein
LPDDILLASNDFAGYSTGKFQETLYFQFSGLIKDVPDFYGLQSWDEKHLIPWDNYKLVWLHLNPRIMYPFWYNFPKLIREEIGDITMIISHEYFEKYYDKPMEYQVRDCLRYADYIHVNSRMGRDIVEENTDTPTLYISISQPIPDFAFDFPESLSFEDKSGIVTLDNTVDTNYIPLFETLRMADIPVTILTANPSKDTDWCANLVEAYGLTAEVYSRLPWTEYIEKLNGARVAVAMGYNGICRFAYECAKVHTPVVGHNRLEFRNILYPEITTTNSIIAGAKIINIYTDKGQWKYLNRYSDTIVQNYWNEESVDKRYRKLLERVEYYD